VRACFQNEEVQNAIKEASRLLKRNPRRIKQFINLFRLKMFLINCDKEKMSYFEDSTEKLTDFVFMLAWSMQWSDIARIVTDSPHSAEICDYLLFLCEKYQLNDMDVFSTIIADLLDRRSKVEKFPAHWYYLPWEEWIYDKGFRFCIEYFHEQWQLRKDGEKSTLLELIRL